MKNLNKLLKKLTNKTKMKSSLRKFYLIWTNIMRLEDLKGSCKNRLRKMKNLKKPKHKAVLKLKIAKSKKSQ